MKRIEPPRARRMGRAAAALLLAAAAIVPAALTAPAAAATVEPGDAVWVGPGVGYPGTSIHPVYSPVPADTANPGTPDLWSYCIEHDISVRPDAVAVAGDYASYLGSNHFTDPVIQAKVHWVITHAYPAVSLADLAVAAGATGLAANDAIEGAQYAVWRYTDLTFDANWAFETPASAAVYWYLVNGANADTATAPPATTDVEVSVSAPAVSGAAGSLVGPFTVSTNQATVTLSSNPMHAFTDAAGGAIDPAAVVNGQQVYLDLRDSTTAGSATVTATANGASGTGLVISTPEEGSATATPGSHRQSLILVTAENATTAASATGTWVVAAAPTIGTSLVDAADEDHTLVWNGGSLVDTIAYSGLTVGQEYTVAGELMVQSDGSATGITGSTTFTPTASDGTVEVTFTVPTGYAGEALVAFETLYSGGTATGTPVAEHKDIDDVNQTVTVEEVLLVPTIGTTLVDAADEDHVLTWNGGSLVDTIAYSGLTVAQEYTVAGELMRKSDGTATGITGQTTFTPTSSSGTVEVT
ncbi:MAG: VaFE repeat-containing surface-anchored protein, partial [Microbacterium sp.]|uniref:VaFE repeat-containing surface-anchored protein n=1 Tax=Microbacterium sp. TaxID=51671 RepID=UPI001D8ABD7E